MFDIVSTKSALKKVLKKELITVNRVIATTATMISGGETIQLHFLEEKLPNKIFTQTLTIQFEDTYVAVIDKPAGILVSGNTFKTVANALCKPLMLLPVFPINSKPVVA